MSERCPSCSKGTLSATTVLESISYKDTLLAVPGVAISVCDQCHDELVTSTQARSNQVRFADARRVFDGLLTSGDIRTIRSRLSLSQEAASCLFGGGANAFSKYERGEVTQSRAMDLLLRAANALPNLRSWLANRTSTVVERIEWQPMSLVGELPSLATWSTPVAVTTLTWTNSGQTVAAIPDRAGNVVPFDRPQKTRARRATIIEPESSWGNLKSSNG